VVADGGAGSDDESGDCDGPGVGAGGGSGGAVAVVANVVDLTNGSLSADGGAGGDGQAGGGGGGGGVVKIAAPVVYDVDAVSVAGGSRGTSACAEFDQGGDGDGADGITPRLDAPVAWLAPIDEPWRRGTDLEVGYSAAAGVENGEQPSVVLCGVRHPVEASLDPESSPHDVALPDHATVSIGAPCGAIDGHAVPILGSSSFDGAVSPPGATIATDEDLIGTEAGNGYWSLYATVLQPGVLNADNDCLDHSDFVLFGLPNGGLLFDQFDCRVELPGGGLEPVTVGIDNTPPTFEVGVAQDTVGQFGQPAATLQITGAADEMLRDDNNEPVAERSGIARFECSNDGVAYTRCADGGGGDVVWALPPGAGEKTVFVRAVDRAGNTTESTVTVWVDAEPPTSTGSIHPAEPDGAEGWYRTVPTLRIGNYDDPDSESEPRFEYWFDNRPHQTCTDNPCEISSDVPARGEHTFWWQAIDEVGHRSEPQSIPFMVDGDAPVSALSLAPARPDGANDWYTTRPFAVLSAADQPDGSGLGDAGPTFSLNGMPELPFVEPVQLPPGTSNLCWAAADLAGNPEGLRCEFDIDVDVDAPTVAIASLPAAPDGDGGWFVSPPTVTVGAADDGSGLGPVDGADLPGLCAGDDVPPGEPEAAGVCVSVDGGPWVPDPGPMVLEEGLRTVRAFAVDVAGLRSPVIAGTFRIDLSFPVSELRTVPDGPNATGWYRRAPLVTLRAVDGHEGSGVAVLEYRIDGDQWQVYDGPFPAPVGVHTIEHRARDVAGWQLRPASREIAFDPDATVVEALDPDPDVLVVVNLLGIPILDNTAELHWRVTDATSEEVSVSVTVYDEAGVPVRHLDAGTFAVVPGVPLTGSTTWDGRDDLLELLALGPYYYRVAAVDQAGNTAYSGESGVVTTAAGILP
ncbi:MAG: hypothetical protein ACRD0G_06585, partial [Acidimicrobiales bacterium]